MIQSITASTLSNAQCVYKKKIFFSFMESRSFYHNCEISLTQLLELAKTYYRFDWFARWSSPKFDVVQRKVVQLTRAIRWKHPFLEKIKRYHIWSMPFILVPAYWMSEIIFLLKFIFVNELWLDVRNLWVFIYDSQFLNENLQIILFFIESKQWKTTLKIMCM